MSTILRVSVAIVVAVTPNHAFSQSGHEIGSDLELDRGRLIQLVLEANPRVEGMRSALRASEARVDAAERWDDPRLSASVAPLSLDDSRIGASVGLSQEIPWPGRLDARADIAAAAVSAGRAELDEVRTALAFRASALFDRWYLVHRALELNAYHQELVTQMRSSAETQYVVGNAAQQDPLQAEVRGTRLRLEETELELSRRTLRAAINTLMRRSPDEVLPPPPARMPSPSLRPGPLLPPAVTEAEAAVSRAEAELRMARLETRPDVMAMGEYSSMFMENDHRIMAGLSLRLPLQRARIEANIRAAEAELEASRALLLAVLDESELEYRNALYELESRLETLDLYENHLIPASRDQTEAAQVGFVAGRNSFLAVLDAENNLQEVLLGYHTILSEAWTAAAAVEAARGVIPFSQEISNEP